MKYMHQQQPNATPESVKELVTALEIARRAIIRIENALRDAQIELALTQEIGNRE